MTDTKRGLRDPRGRESDALSWEADKAMKAGDMQAARQLYAGAAVIEEEIAADAGEEPIRVRSVLAVSAAALWYKAGEWHKVESLAHRWLADPSRLTPDARAELRDLLQRAWTESEIPSGDEDDTYPVEIRLMGKSVHRGLAPAKLVKRKEERFIAMLERTGEWRLGMEFRRTGKSVLAKQLDVLVAPARAASYGIRLYVRSSMTDAKGQLLDTATLLTEFFSLVSTPIDALKARVSDELYLQVFLSEIGDLSADGEQVADVVYSVPTWRLQLPEVHLDASVHERATQLRSPQRTAQSEWVGRLFSSSDVAGKRWLKLEIDGQDLPLKILVDDNDWDVSNMRSFMYHTVRVRVRTEGNRLLLRDIRRI